MLDHASKHREESPLFKLNKSLTSLRNYSRPFEVDTIRQLRNKIRTKSGFPRKSRREYMKRDRIKRATHAQLYYHNVWVICSHLFSYITPWLPA